jgi:hypothetical protein
MYRTVGGVLVLLLALPALRADDKPKDKPTTPEGHYKALLKEYQDAQAEYSKALREAKTAEERNKVFQEKSPKPEKFAPKFLELAEKNPKDPVAVDALVWVVANDRGGAAGKDSPRSKAIAILLRDHVASDKVGRLSQTVANGYDKPGADLLRGILEKNPNAEAKADACLGLAQRISTKAMLARHLKENPDDAKRFEQFLGKEVFEEIQKTDAAKFEAESGQLYKEFGEKYAAEMKPERLTQLCQTLTRSGASGEPLLRALLEKDKRHEVQGNACLALAESLKGRADELAASNQKEADKLLKESEQLLQRAADKYADVKLPFRGTVGEKAKGVLFAVQHLAIGKEVPDIEGVDADSKKFKLSDYRGKVVLLDFWGNW